ncbi:MAG: dihydroorotase [Ignavibacteria bacterium]|nr:dihydroorotase [Ignavibacteria bacterium]
MDIILKNIRIFSPEDELDLKADILIENGIIKEIGKVSDRAGIQTRDCAKLTAVPGFFDMHVHFRDPGQTHKEDLKSGNKSAVNGGFTGVLMMPNTNPPIDSVEIISDLLKRSEDSIADIYTSGCISSGRKGESLASIEELHSAGAIAFTDDGSPVLNSDIMAKVLEYSSKLKFPVLQHAENPSMHPYGVVNKGNISEKLNVGGISCDSETSVVSADILLANSVPDSKYHIQHISCARTLDIIREAKKENPNITCEICPHHFILTDEECIKQGANAKVNPPLRTQEDIDYLLTGIADGTIDVLCTDHAPHTETEKSQGIDKAPFGIIGLEAAIGLGYTYLVKKKTADFKRFVEMFSINPRKILGLKKVRIKEGEKANITILDTEKNWTLKKENFKSKSRNTPYNNFRLTCKPFAVINNNKIFYSEL